jgi:hypothetical protein
MQINNFTTSYCSNDGDGEKNDGGENKKMEGMMIRKELMNPKMMVKTRRVNAIVCLIKVLPCPPK